MTPKKAIFALKIDFQDTEKYGHQKFDYPINGFLRQKWHIWVSYKYDQVFAHLNNCKTIFLMNVKNEVSHLRDTL